MTSVIGDLNTVYSRLLEFWYHADPVMKADGMEWYEREHEWGVSVAREHGLSADMIFGAVSALSPSTNWEQNKLDMLNVILYGAGATVTTYGINKDKALRILNGSDVIAELDKPTSLKTWHFYNCLQNPNTTDYVAVDRHHAYACGIEDKKKLVQTSIGPREWVTGTKLTREQYRECVRVTQEAAAMVRYKARRVRPNQFQAVVWGEAQLRKGRL